MERARGEVHRRGKRPAQRAGGYGLRGGKRAFKIPIHCCPGCGLAIENEIAMAEDPLLRDVELLAQK